MPTDPEFFKDWTFDQPDFDLKEYSCEVAATVCDEIADDICVMGAYSNDGVPKIGMLQVYALDGVLVKEVSIKDIATFIGMGDTPEILAWAICLETVAHDLRMWAALPVEKRHGNLYPE